jgi:hypothetical protein
MTSQNPLVRVEQVARDLGRLADELERYAGEDARVTLLFWRSELRAALDEIERLSAPGHAA